MGFSPEPRKNQGVTSSLSHCKAKLLRRDWFARISRGARKLSHTPGYQQKLATKVGLPQKQSRFQYNNRVRMSDSFVYLFLGDLVCICTRMGSCFFEKSLQFVYSKVYVVEVH